MSALFKDRVKYVNDLKIINYGYKYALADPERPLRTIFFSITWGISVKLALHENAGSATVKELLKRSNGVTTQNELMS